MQNSQRSNLTFTPSGNSKSSEGKVLLLLLLSVGLNYKAPLHNFGACGAPKEI